MTDEEGGEGDEDEADLDDEERDEEEMMWEVSDKQFSRDAFLTNTQRVE